MCLSNVHTCTCVGVCATDTYNCVTMIRDYRQSITWLRRLAVIAVVTSLASRVTSYDSCSVKFGRRGCAHRVVHGVSVVCNGHHVETVVPYNIPADTVHLTLVGFNLTRLTRADLDRFANVQCLTVTDSLALTEIDADAFSGLGSLVELTLDSTNINESQLAFIADESFANIELLAVTRDESLTHFTGHGATRQLHALRSLDLKHCAIDHISSSLYHELRRLERLDLTGNKLSSLNWTQIGGHITHLNSLLLAGNRLQTLPVSAHSVLYTVKELSLGDNPLHCNCQLHWLRDFYQQSAVDKTMDAVHCVSPEPQQLDDLVRDQRNAINFKCVGPEAPVIVWTKYDSDHRVEVNKTIFRSEFRYERRKVKGVDC